MVNYKIPNNEGHGYADRKRDEIVVCHIVALVLVFKKIIRY